MNYPALAFIFGDSCGTMEWLVIAIVVIIVFGPKNLPDIIRKAGKGMAVMRRAADEFKDQIMQMDQPVSKPTDYTVSSPYPDDYDNGDSSGDVMTDIDGVPAVNTYVAPALTDHVADEHLTAGSEEQPTFPCAALEEVVVVPAAAPVSVADVTGENKPC